MYFDHKTHEQIITDIFENVREGYDQSLQMLNYACFLSQKNKTENITVQDWLKRVKFEIDLKMTKVKL
mgnify:FL=1